ncbi:helix-turn-helix transcriptional regulator [Actinomadura rayongensis]|uniref:helix-turn-helix transcriptional regulator n=1 Tax=Actinomadura rayongensis TaxID=1429076 RepID=UPI0035E58DAB
MSLPRPPDGDPALVGRTADLDLLRAFLSGAAADGRALVLSGEAGVGKTALLDRAAALADAAGATVLRASGVEFETDLGFAGLNQLLLPLAGLRGGLPAAHRDALNVALGLDAGDPPERLLVLTAALRLLRDAAATGPLLVVVDDVQWLDRPSAAALGFVARRLVGARVGVLAAARTEAGGFFDASGLPRHEVAPLDEPSAAGLLRARFPRLSSGARRRVLGAARGNPLALLELPAALDDRPGAPPGVLPLTGRLQAVFAARLADLGPATRALLLLAALDGGGDPGVLQRAAGAADLADLGPAERARLVRVDGDGRLRFRHPLIGSALVAAATLAERRAAHGRLAAALAGDPERRARHAAEAAAGPDEGIAGRLERAALPALRRGDAGGAVAALVRAAELSPGVGDRARRLTSAAYVGANLGGRLREAAGLLSDARRADPAVAASLRATVAAAFLLLNGDGEIQLAHRLLAGAIETSAHDRADLFEALHMLLLVCVYGGRPELWPAFEDALKTAPRPLPPALELCGALFADPVAATPASLRRLDAAIAGLREQTDPEHIIRVGLAGVFIDRVSACRDALARVVDLGRAGSAPTPSINALVALALEAFHDGRWERSRALADEALGVCEEHGYHLLAWSARYQLALLAAVRGDDAAATALTERIRAWTAPRRILSADHYCAHVHALAALGRGDVEDAYRHAASVAPPGRLPARTPQALWVCFDLVEAAVRTGRDAAARAHAAALDAAGVAALSPRLALLAGGASAMTAPEDAFGALFERVLAGPGAERWPFDHARVRLAYGERLRRAAAARPRPARDQLAEALDVFERLGARPWADRARRELGASGRARAVGGLTAREEEVAALAAAGLTNRQIGEKLFLSPRTVGAHLYRIFPKLGVATRAALRDALAARSEPGPGS